MVHSCVSNMSSPSGVVFAAFLGGFRSSTHDSSRHSGTGFLSSWSLCWHDCYVIRLFQCFHAVIAYSHAQFQLYFAHDVCRAPFRPTQPASIDELLSRMFRLRFLLSHLTPLFGARIRIRQLIFMCCHVSAPWTIHHLSHPQSLWSSILLSAKTLLCRSGYIVIAHLFSRSFFPWIVAFFHDFFSFP